VRNGPGRSAASCPDSRSRPSGPTVTGLWADCAPGETGVLVIGGPAVFAGYVTDPGTGGPG
jgi:hypothetical protein